MTLTANTPLTIIRGEQSEIPAAAVVVYEGAMLGDNGSGYGRGLVAGDPFRGHSMEYLDNSGGSAGDVAVTCLRGVYRLEVTIASVAITDVGKNVYGSADSTYTLVASGNSRVGRIVRFVTTNTAIVEFQTADYVANKLLYANTAGATSVENTTDETDFDKSVTVDGDLLKLGDVLHIRGHVWVEDQNSTDTLTLKL